MPFVDVPGTRIFHRTAGMGTDVVLVHGLGASHAFWYPKVAPALARRHRVTVYDLRGHGRSGMPGSGYGAAAMVADLEALLDALDIRRARLVGHSWGGLIALELALRRPRRVTAVVVADSRLGPARTGVGPGRWSASPGRARAGRPPRPGRRRSGRSAAGPWAGAAASAGWRCWTPRRRPASSSTPASPRRPGCARCAGPCSASTASGRSPWPAGAAWADAAGLPARRPARRRALPSRGGARRVPGRGRGVPAPMSRGLTAADFHPVGVGGFGDGGNAYAHTMAWFDGRLFVGATRHNLALLHMHAPPPLEPWPVPVPPDVYDLDLRGRILAFDPATGAARWALVAPMVAGRDGRAVPRDIGFRGMAVVPAAAGRPAALYATTWSPARSQRPPLLLRTVDGEGFETVGPVGGDAGTSTFRALVAHGDRLFCAPTGRRQGARTSRRARSCSRARAWGPARGGPPRRPASATRRTPPCSSSPSRTASYGPAR
ncbi:MAG: alpha/beta hydrolase [Solirubrobacterales bacterium]